MTLTHPMFPPSLGTRTLPAGTDAVSVAASLFHKAQPFRAMLQHLRAGSKLLRKRIRTTSPRPRSPRRAHW